MTCTSFVIHVASWVCVCVMQRLDRLQKTRSELSVLWYCWDIAGIVREHCPLVTTTDNNSEAVNVTERICRTTHRQRTGLQSSTVYDHTHRLTTVKEPGTFSTCHGVFRGAELFPQLVHIIWMNLLVEGAAEPLRLRMVEDGRHRVWHVDHTARLRSDHKQEAVRSLQDQVL